MLEQWVTLIIL